ncbi:uncharacterized mitochondrial protein AtMg00810-like [Telopea speciosissima]|uniref:uncharacterized mitochondrial protein AtMg00810-like n=1 Tax=Telopea speciosissima TaxID=54955 RepID=UPI001CC750F5|nr:uncharacterized mitochondrial protein AtMg00810-like [Telopea speciosissima]
MDIEVIRNKKGLSLSQRKYVLNLLTETGMLGCKPVDTLMDPHVKLGASNDREFADKHRYKIKRLIYRRHGHTDIIGYSDGDWVGADGDRRSTTGYCTFVEGNLVTRKNKKQTIIAGSNAEAEYKATG